jgi:hypothetical protein
VLIPSAAATLAIGTEATKPSAAPTVPTTMASRTKMAATWRGSAPRLRSSATSRRRLSTTTANVKNTMSAPTRNAASDPSRIADRITCRSGPP